ncbi:MAG: hypothetical protein LLF28_02055 [Nitrospiraceae bacterium]|nr:hypothetical protein [Nitrospiraceae bacterium]
MSIMLIFIGFFILIMIPFIPGIIEMLRPKDSDPLFIKMDYTKDPRYFGTAFKSLLKESLSDLKEGNKDVRLSKDEVVKISSSENIKRNTEVSTIIYFLGKLESEDNVKFDKEIYVADSVEIGANGIVRAIACDRDISLSENVNVIRWLDAEGKITAENGCDLGISSSCSKEFRIADNCRFKRILGSPVITFRKSNGRMSVSNKERHAILVDDEKCTVIPENTETAKTIIIKQDLLIKDNCIFRESVKAYGNIIIGKNVQISGNLFSEKSIDILEGSQIKGNVFSQGHIQIRNNVEIGTNNKMKSVIGKKGVLIGQDVTIHGYIMTEGAGLIT